jgi:hypothetical protein
LITLLGCNLVSERFRAAEIELELDSAKSLITEEKVSALTSLQTLVALTLKLPSESVSSGATIKELFSGQSAKVLSQMLRDVATEFGATPASAGDMALRDLAAQLDAGYTKLGAASTSLLEALFSTKMAAGFGTADARAYLMAKFGLPSGRVDAIMLRLLLSAPASAPTTTAASQSLLDQVAAVYASSNGITLSNVRSPLVYWVAEQRLDFILPPSDGVGWSISLRTANEPWRRLLADAFSYDAPAITFVSPFNLPEQYSKGPYRRFQSLQRPRGICACAPESHAAGVLTIYGQNFVPGGLQPCDAPDNGLVQFPPCAYVGARLCTASKWIDGSTITCLADWSWTDVSIRVRALLFTPLPRLKARTWCRHAGGWDAGEGRADRHAA